MCQAALPAFETALRKRPLAIQNEGAATVFVSCAYTFQAGGRQGEDQFVQARLSVQSVGGHDIAIQCTGVWGVPPSFYAYSVKSVVAPASGAAVGIEWTGADIAPGHSGGEEYFSVSCTLPAGAAIADGWIRIHDDS